MIGIIIAFAAGTMFGAAIICCCVAAGRADRDAESLDGKFQ